MGCGGFLFFGFFFVIIWFSHPLLPLSGDCRAVLGWLRREVVCGISGQKGVKAEWSNSKVRRGGQKKTVGLQEWGCNQVSVFCGCRSGFVCVSVCVCVCVCVCACVHMRQSYKGFGLLQWSLGVNLWALTLFPFSAIALSTYSKSLAFCSLLSELSLLAAAAAAAAAAQAPFSQSAALMSFISMAGSEDGPLKTFSSRGDRAATMGQRPSMLSQ